jgi:hypothetical protein
MLPTNLLSNTWNTVSILALSGVLLGSTFALPTWAMEEEGQDQYTILHTQTHASFFNYDLTYLEEARQVVAQADFLPEPIKLWFKVSAETYDRRKFLPYLDPKEQENFFDHMASKVTKSPMPDETRAAISAIDPGLIEKLDELYCKTFRDSLPALYQPYFNNIEDNIRERGTLNYALFDTFFHMLLRINEIYSFHEGNSHPQAAPQKIFQKLEQANFLKNFDAESLTKVEEIYGPCEQLKLFHKNKKKEVTDLVIGGGHRGVKGIKCISQYKNTLTIDLCPSELPDIISDINNPQLLNALLGHYESHFQAIYDASNMSGFNADGFIKPETTNYLVRLLRPGGFLMQQASEDVKPFRFNDATVKHFKETYDLIPIYSSENPEQVVSLQKK